MTDEASLKTAMAAFQEFVKSFTISSAQLHSLTWAIGTLPYQAVTDCGEFRLRVVPDDLRSL